MSLSGQDTLELVLSSWSVTHRLATVQSQLEKIENTLTIYNTINNYNIYHDRS